MAESLNVFVTGATGFLGQSLQRALLALGHRVTGIGSRDADLTADEALGRWDIERFDQIWHLAAWTQAGDFCLAHPGEQWIRNQRINTCVLDWWQRRQPQAKLVAIGTSCAYDPGLPLVESNYLAGVPIDSLLTYAMTKRMLYVGQAALAKQFGLRYLCLVPSTLYGPGYHLDGRQMHFIFDLIRKILRGKLYSEPVVLWGDGEQQRELVYIDDFVNDAIRLAATCDNELVNIGAGGQHSIRDFASAICRIAGFDPGDVRFDTTRYVGARSKCLVVDKLQTLLPEWRRTSLESGLRRTIDWFLARRDALLAPQRAA